MKVNFASIVAFSAVVFGTASSSFAVEVPPMSNACVSPNALKTLNECPGGPEKFEARKKVDAAFKSAPPPRETNKRTDAKPGDIAALAKFADRDTRKTRLQARARALLITEIQGLERLYKQTPKKSPDRPQLVRRLAEGYVELESAAERDRIASDIKAQDAKAKKKDSGKHRSDASRAKKIVVAARKSAIKYYTSMKDEYPDYSKLDEVLYYLAYEHEQAGDYKNARKVYYELVQKAPKSSYIPNAYLAFGELFYQDAQGDPTKWALAESAYKEVAKYPPPSNKVYGYSRYKLGYVYWNAGELAQALNEFKAVIEYGDKFGELPNAKQLAKAARRDLVPVYASSGAPERAFNFFRPLSGDSGAEKTETIRMMNELGTAYMDTGHYKEGVVLYQDLMGRDPGPKYCFYQSQITQAIQAIFSGDKDRVVKELDQQIRVRGDYLKQNYPADLKLECSNRTAEFLAETAMSWHLEAVGSGGVRGTGDKKTMDLAAATYKRVAETFTAQDFKTFKFPRIAASDWPTMYKIRYAMADLLYFQQRWEECGPAFDAVVMADPKGEAAAEAAYASVLCYQKMYEQMYKGESDRKGKGLGPKGSSAEDRKAKSGEWEKYKPKELSTVQKGMVQAFSRYICFIKPPKGNAEAEEQYVEVKYARARQYFEAQHWEEAALAFRDVAINYSEKEVGIFAAQLYLESVNVLGSKTEPPRPTCFDDMAGDVLVFLDLYCKGPKAEENKDQCALLTTIKFDVQRLSAQKTVELADTQAAKGSTRESLENYKKGGDAYLALWQTYCEKPLEAGEKPKQCERADEIVYNMAKAYQAGRLLLKSIQARMVLLNPKFGLHETELARKATYEIGGNYQAIAVYDRAATFFERYAKETKYKGEFADKALSDAVVLRLGLGHEDEAIEGAKAFNKYYGRGKPAETAQIAFAIASHYGEKKDWEGVRKQLFQTMKMIDSSATLDVRAQAHALLGRAYVQMERATPADSEYKSVTGLWKDPAKAVAEIRGLSGESPSAQDRRLGRALDAVGEALFYFAEKKKQKVDAIEFPVYKGPGTKEAVVKHIQVSVAEWIKKKRPLIEEASGSYKEVIDLQPVPPPRWVISAGSRVGEMWGTFVKEFRAAPIPDFIKKDYELRTSYFGALDDASEPQKKQARSAYEVCLGYSVKYQYFDEFSRACEEWLAQNYKAEYHLIDEFRGAPDRVNSVLREQSRPLRIGGEPMVDAPPPDARPKPPTAAKKDEG